MQLHSFPFIFQRVPPAKTIKKFRTWISQIHHLPIRSIDYYTFVEQNNNSRFTLCGWRAVESLNGLDTKMTVKSHHETRLNSIEDCCFILIVPQILQKLVSVSSRFSVHFFSGERRLSARDVSSWRTAGPHGEPVWAACMELLCTVDLVCEMQMSV